VYRIRSNKTNMSDSKQSDHWDILASVLGAEPEKKEPVEAAPQAEEKAPKTRERYYNR